MDSHSVEVVAQSFVQRVRLMMAVELSLLRVMALDSRMMDPRMKLAAVEDLCDSRRSTPVCSATGSKRERLLLMYILAGPVTLATLSPKISKQPCLYSASSRARVPSSRMMVQLLQFFSSLLGSFSKLTSSYFFFQSTSSNLTRFLSSGLRAMLSRKMSLYSRASILAFWTAIYFRSVMGRQKSETVETAVAVYSSSFTWGSMHPTPDRLQSPTLRRYTTLPSSLYSSMSSPRITMQTNFCFSQALSTGSSFWMQRLSFFSKRSLISCWDISLKIQFSCRQSWSVRDYLYTESFSSLNQLFSMISFICLQKKSSICPYTYVCFSRSFSQVRIEWAAFVFWMRVMIQQYEIFIWQSRNDWASLRFDSDSSISLYWTTSSKGIMRQASSHSLMASRQVDITSQRSPTRSYIQEQAQRPMMGLFLSQQQTGKKKGLSRWEMRQSQELRGSSIESKSKFTHQMRTLRLSLEHWLFSNLLQMIPFSAMQKRFLISLMRLGSMLSSSIRCQWRAYVCSSWVLFAWAFSAPIGGEIRRCRSQRPDCSSTLSQIEFYRYWFFFMSSIFLERSFSHSRMNFLNRRCLVSLFTHSPIFFMKKLAVGALIISVRNAHPEVLNSEAVLNVGFKEVLEARIRVNAMPTAPLSPPQVRASTSFHLSPYPSF